MGDSLWVERSDSLFFLFSIVCCICSNSFLFFFTFNDILDIRIKTIEQK